MSRILVVDDDDQFLQTIKLILSDYSFNVETTTSQDDIYRHILLFDPQVILLDIHLNGADGRNICRGLKNHFKTKKIPIVLISGDHTISSYVPECSADGFVEKPVNVQQLIKTLNNFCKPISEEDAIIA